MPEQEAFRQHVRFLAVSDVNSDLVTPTGRIEDLNIPRDCAEAFHRQVFERSAHYEPEVAEALTDMFVSGSSTHRMGQVAEKLLGVTGSRQSREPCQPGADRAI